MEPVLTTVVEPKVSQTPFQVAKEDYCQQLAKWFEGVKFAGIAVPGQEVDKSERLPEIFVMPDVEDISTGSIEFEREFLLQKDRPRQTELMPKQRERSLMKNSTKFLASQLLTRGQSRNKAVLLGPPGSGKTTLMSYFAVMLARRRPEVLGLAADADWLPILIRIRDWERHSEEMTLLEYVRHFAESRMAVKTLPGGFFEHWLEEGRALILLDGLDEVARVEKRDRIAKRIESFLHQYEKNWAIVTSRPAGYRRDFFGTEEFPHYELQPFDDDKIEQFIDNWYDSRVRDPVEAQTGKDSLQRALAEHDRIKLLARNPLLLTIIALIHRYQAMLPKERHKLYDKAVDTLLTSWDANKEISRHRVLQYLDFEDIRRLMEILAFWVHNQGSVGDNEGGTIVDKEQLISKLSREIKRLKAIVLHRSPDEANAEAERFLGLMQERAGLFNEQGQDCYAFVHKTFQEYLCAREINYQADNEDDFETVLGQIRERLHDAHWREVLLLSIAQLSRKKAARAIRAILNAGSEYEEWLHRDLLFAGSCLAENPTYLYVADRELSGEILRGLVELEVSKRAGDRVRDRVFKILCSMKETDFEGQALELLKERSGDIDEERFLEYRVALGGKEEAIAIFMARLEDEEPEVRGDAAFSLGQLGDSSETVVSALVARLEDEDSEVRQWAADALGYLSKSSPIALRVLLARLKHKKASVRQCVALGLGYSGKSSQRVIKALLARLKDNKASVRANAALALGKLDNRSEAVVSALLERLEDNKSAGINPALVLGSWGNNSETVVSALLERLEHENSNVRGHAALALGKLDRSSETVVSALVKRLNDDRSDVREWAAVALGNLGDSSETVVSALVERLKYEKSSVRQKAVSALKKLGNASETALSAMLPLLEDEDFFVRGDAASVLGNLGNGSETVVGALLERLEREQSLNREETADTFDYFGTESIISAFQIPQKYEKYWTRSYIVNALGKLGNSSEAVIKALLTSLEDEYSGVRGEAVKVLSKLGNSSPTVVSTLVARLEDEDSSVRRKAAEALGKLGKKSPDVVAAVVQWIEQHRESEYLGHGIDALWDAVVEEQS